MAGGMAPNLQSYSASSASLPLEVSSASALARPTAAASPQCCRTDLLIGCIAAIALDLHSTHLLLLINLNSLSEMYLKFFILENIALFFPGYVTCIQETF